MPNFILREGEMQDVLDSIHPNAYDSLIGEIEKKICASMTEDRWMQIFDSGKFKVEMSITFNEEIANENA